ncbi:hypothetical protein QSV34_14385 [Porticoccus sp. W117]|uniref:hypothetical protein n=1 Tax=Porticoccus sp. W117 TaxID=3054777 RepID=UPI002596AC92|nr:hypothetical protein [Porticoccus sp. W117]MDM3872537.1 hypothetical protein [Porticoccus sp. W117]
MHTIMYRIWVRPGHEYQLKSIWRQQAEMLREIGANSGWVVEHGEGECAAYLQWQQRQHWENVRPYCNFMDDVAKSMGKHMLGWLSEYPG